MTTWGIIAALVSAASWACATVLFELLGKKIPSAGITFLKGAFSLILMWILVLAWGKFDHVGTYDAIILIISGIVGISLGDTLFFKSLQDLGAKMQVLYFMLGQIITMALSFLILGEILSLGEYIGAIILVCGIIFVTWGKQEDHPNKWRGIIGGLISIICFSVSTIMIKFTDTDIDIVSATFYRMFAGTLIMLLIGTAKKSIKRWIEPLKSLKTLSLFFLNVIIITIGGFMTSLYAIKHLSVSLASILSTTEPIFVLIFAFLIGKQRVKTREVIGATITIIGLLIIMLHE